MEGVRVCLGVCWESWVGSPMKDDPVIIACERNSYRVTQPDVQAREAVMRTYLPWPTL
jgi:hypothetical protein